MIRKRSTPLVETCSDLTRRHANKCLSEVFEHVRGALTNRVYQFPTDAILSDILCNVRRALNESRISMKAPVVQTYEVLN